MYVTTLVALGHKDGTDAIYEVSADVEPHYGRYMVGEPQLSAAGTLLSEAWLAVDPESLFIDGWSNTVEEQLIEEYLTNTDHDREYP